MKKINFTKMVASGNDFVVIKDKLGAKLSVLSRSLCDRKFGIGADGLLLLSKCRGADFRMRIFNADGSEAEMCGNGARCAALLYAKKKSSILTASGIINCEINGDRVKIQITNPKDADLDIPLGLNGRKIKVNFINTGVPHVVIFVNGIGDVDVRQLGSNIRHHKEFAPAGTNVNFVEPIANNLIRVRTYERGVEDETLACGTGSIAAALIFAIKNNVNDLVRVRTQSKETLRIYFKKSGSLFNSVWLEGGAKIIYKGEYYV
jgi:diaminopimelate epimerase